jgi:hypothetical protein
MVLYPVRCKCCIYDFADRNAAVRGMLILAVMKAYWKQVPRLVWTFCRCISGDRRWDVARDLTVGANALELRAMWGNAVVEWALKIRI